MCKINAGFPSNRGLEWLTTLWSHQESNLAPLLRCNFQLLPFLHESLSKKGDISTMSNLNVISSAYSCRWCIVPWSMIYGTCFQSVRADFAVYFLLLDSVAVVRRESTEVLGVSLPREKAFICIYRCSANPCTNIIPLKRNSQLLRCNKNQVWQTA